MSSRYRNRRILTNRNAKYVKQFNSRGVSLIKQFATAKFTYPTADDLEGLVINTEIYKVGDRFYKYAQKYYGDSTYWWLIAYFNQKPVENMVELGETIYIPTPLTKMLEIFGED